MSTLSSWIDPEEINELLPCLLSKREPAGETEPPEVEDLPDAPEGAAVEEANEEAPEVESAPPAVSSAEPAATGPRIDFDLADAYDPAAFPEAGREAGEEPGYPSRRAAAVQAAVALERARDRANQGGLLRTADADAEIPAEAENDSPPVGESEGGVVPEPGTLRYRLAEFDRFARELTGGSDLVIADADSYPLHPSANGASQARIMASILEMDQAVSELPGGRCAVSQVRLSDTDWLCILKRDSASGGIFARFRVDEPISMETAAQLKSGLRDALAG